MKYYDPPRTVFQKKINDMLPKESDSSPLIFENTFKLQQIYSFEKNRINAKSEDSNMWQYLMTLFNELGPAEFAKVINIFKGKTITFPTEEDYQDSIITSLCYYYKEIEGLDWNQIKEKLSMGKLNTIKYGIRVQQLKGFIDEQMLRAFTKVEQHG